MGRSKLKRFYYLIEETIGRGGGGTTARGLGHQQDVGSCVEAIRNELIGSEVITFSFTLAEILEFVASTVFLILLVLGSSQSLISFDDGGKFTFMDYFKCTLEEV